MGEVDQIKQLLAGCTPEQRRQLFEYLREEFPIHPFEAKLGATAEVILEAISRASDLTQRGVRGLIAESAFGFNVAKKLAEWKEIPLHSDFPYDFLLEDSLGRVRVQVKMQRQKAQRPMKAKEAYTRLPASMYVTETQRTRGGLDTATGEDTRPYRFGEFDILAVSMHPSTRDWSSFFYTVSDWLLPRPENPKYLLKFQPISKQPNEDWTDDFEICVAWLRSGIKKKISYNDTGLAQKRLLDI